MNMSQLWVVVVLFHLSMSAIETESDGLLVQQGDSWYEQGSLEMATVSYEAVQYKTASVWHRLAVVAYQKKEYAKAIVFLRCADCTASVAERNAYQPLLEKIYARLKTTPSSTIVEQARVYWNNYLPRSLLLFQLMFLFLVWLIFFVSFGVSNGWVKWPSLLCMVTVITVSGVELFLRKGEQGGEHGFIVSATPLYAGPGNEFHKIGNLTPCTIVSVGRIKEMWYHIATDTKNGWVYCQNIVPIKAH